MAYLIPPMADEAPPDFVVFVAARLARLRSEAARLLGGDRAAQELASEVLTDLAGHWRWLSWRSRLTNHDAATDYLNRRLTTRTKHWREDQIYPVEVTVLGDTAGPPQPESAQQRVGVTTAPRWSQTPPDESLARQMACLLPSTVRAGSDVVAEAEIAWVHAYRRYLWHHYLRFSGGMVLLIGGMIQFMSQFSTT